MKPLLKIVLQQVRHSFGAFALGIWVALVPAIAGLLLLGVSGWFITAAAIAGMSGAFLNIFVPSAVIRALAILRTAGRYGERMLTHDATFRFLADLRNRLFSAIAMKGRVGHRSGTVLNRLTQDIAALDTVYLRLIVPFVVIIATAFLLLVIWALLSPTLLVSGTVFLLLWFALIWYAAQSSDEKNAKRADYASDAMRLRAADFAVGRRDLAVYGGLEAPSMSILEADIRLEAAEEDVERRAIRLTLWSSLVGQVFLAAMLLVAVLGVHQGQISPAVAVGLVLVVVALPEIFGQILPGIANLLRTVRASGRVISLLTPTQQEKGTNLVAGHQARPSTSAVLKFEKVSFGYSGAQRNVIEKLSFEINPGEILAVAGRSGTGKSTVAALAARLQQPGKGHVYLKGLELDAVPEDILRQKVTVVSQRPYLFNDTIAANLRVANPDATDTELWIALAQSALATRISDGQLGLESVLGEGGVGLSGGEQRRLALARAFLTRPDLFILDEMTEGLDAETATDVLERFLSFKGQAAVLMIAHKRLELETADSILYLPSHRFRSLPD